MLMLTRRIGQVIYLDLPDGRGRVSIHVSGIRGNLAQIGISAPSTVAITRAELEQPQAKAAPSPRR